MSLQFRIVDALEDFLDYSLCRTLNGTSRSFPGVLLGAFNV